MSLKVFDFIRFFKRKNNQYRFEKMTKSGVYFSIEKALKIPSVFACISLKARTVASLPLSILDNDNNKINDILQNKNQLNAILHSVILSCEIHGNAYLLYNRNKNKIKLQFIDFNQIICEKNENEEIIYRFQETNEQIDNIIHLKPISFNGWWGVSPLQQATETIGGQIAADDTAFQAFKNGLKIGGILKLDDRLIQSEQAEQIKARLENFTDPKNTNPFLVLTKGQEFIGNEKGTISLQQAQLLETRQFGIEEICRVFGVPPALIGHISKTSSWSSSLENLNQLFLTYTIDPLLVYIETVLTNEALTESQRRDGLKFKFSRKALLRADTATRTAMYREMLRNGVYTTNEVRELEDIPPASDENSNNLRIELNMTKLSDLGVRENE